MTVQALLDQLKLVLEQGIVSENDEVILIGSGDKPFSLLGESILAPSVILSRKSLIDMTNFEGGRLHLGFTLLEEKP